MTTNNQHPQLASAEILPATLAAEGTTTVFGYPRGAILPIDDAFRKSSSIHNVLVRHEQGASILRPHHLAPTVASSNRRNTLTP